MDNDLYMKHKILLILLLSITFSCSEPIDFNLNEGENNRLVVDGGITDELKIQKIRLTRSADYLLNQIVLPELEAEVRVSDDDNVFIYKDNDNDGIYETEIPVAGEPGKTYTLNIKLTDNETYTAEAYMNPIGEIDSLRYEYIEEFTHGDNGPEKLFFYKIYLFAQEPETTGDYYLWDLFLDNELDTDTLREKVFSDDQSINGNYITGAELFWIENQKIENEITIATVTMKAISKEQYNHNLALMLETDWRRGPFQGPPANVPSNINNGALGFFSANAVSSISIEMNFETNPDYWE